MVTAIVDGVETVSRSERETGGTEGGRWRLVEVNQSGMLALLWSVSSALPRNNTLIYVDICVAVIDRVVEDPLVAVVSRVTLSCSVLEGSSLFRASIWLNRRTRVPLGCRSIGF